ncbi:septum formation family protein [Micromonospora polyrhachis]|uniref:Septum formation-related domain-containing protein n=1 Tax=Micromonospora polyrhachis TaxID=1282883 RepID=A0A7W7SVL0_9ACTN|nr:septum formation family protein [Micromonospora polyrhachis]MBB4961688.1 hypothetical protein [Micromonospora polyrhachis]
MGGTMPARITTEGVRMRRRLTLGALGVVTALTLTGCGSNPAGVDGNLTDDWAAIGEPTVFVPQPGTCHPTVTRVEGTVHSYHVVDCAQLHSAETTHVGTFVGEDAERVTPPPSGSPSRHTAWRECDSRTTERLGGEWRAARLNLSLVLPSPQAWTGGARWFRCEVSETYKLDTDLIPVPRTGSLKGILGKKSDLQHGCFNPKLAGDIIQEMVKVPCTTPHHSEFVGIYTAPDTSFEMLNQNSELLHAGCRSVVASYVQVPDDRRLIYRTGTITYPPTRISWDSGNRGVRCFLWLEKRTVTRTLKGTGSNGLPVTTG